MPPHFAANPLGLLPASGSFGALGLGLTALVAGTAWQLQQATLWPGWLYGWLVLDAAGLFFCGLRYTRAGHWRNALVCASLAVLGFGLAGARANHQASQRLDPALEGRDMVVTGWVAAMPQRNYTDLRLRFEVASAMLAGQAVRLPPLLQLGWYGGAWRTEPTDALALQAQPPEVKAGEHWRLTVRLKAPHGNRNPHGFDYELWLWEQGVLATGYVRTSAKDLMPERLGSSWRHPVEQARQHMRDAIFAQVSDRQMAGIVAALATGDQQAIDRADWDVFRASGVAHLMSISGLHITMFAWLAALLVNVLWRRSARLCVLLPAPHAALAGGLALAAAYALFSGWGVPAQRTVCMLAVAALLQASGRHWPATIRWLLVMAAVVVLDPWALLQAGFWLSFVAVAVLFATNSGAESQVSTRAWGRFGLILREQAVVTVALAPLTLLLFGQVSLVGLLANLLAIPWVTLVLTPLALLGMLFAPVWTLAAAAANALAWVLQPLAAWPLATYATAAAPLWAGVAGLLGGVLLVWRWPWPLRCLGLPLLLPVLLWQAARPPPGEFELLAADVGQGTAVLVRTARHTLVYDAGPRFSSESDAGHRVLVPLLRAFDERVNTLVLSHRDLDHTGGAEAVLAMQPQAKLLSSIEAQHPLQALRAATRCHAGQRWDWDGVAFEVLHPLADDYQQTRKSNAMSCVLRVSNGQRHALLTGDIEAAQEARLVASGVPLRSDVLLVPHHGSKTSSSEAFLAQVAPRFALAQVGYRNRFGHPAPSVLARYQALGIAVLDSPSCGAMGWRSAEPEVMACQRARSRRYWHHRGGGAGEE